MNESRLHDAAESWFPPTPSVAAAARQRLPARPDPLAERSSRRRVLVVALAALLLTGAAVAASALDLVPGVRIQRVEQLPEIPFATVPFYGAETTLEEARRTVPFELMLPPGLGEPDSVLLDRDRSGAPVATAVYGGGDGARLVLTQWAGGDVLFDKLLTFDSSATFVDVDGASGIWIEGEEHAVFYVGDSGRRTVSAATSPATSSSGSAGASRTASRRDLARARARPRAQPASRVTGRRTPVYPGHEVCRSSQSASSRRRASRQPTGRQSCGPGSRPHLRP